MTTPRDTVAVHRTDERRLFMRAYARRSDQPIATTIADLVRDALDALEREEGRHEQARCRAVGSLGDVHCAAHGGLGVWRGRTLRCPDHGGELDEVEVER